MQPISPKQGIYQFTSVHFEIINGVRVPIGTGYYKYERTPSFRNEEIRVRLQSLYNKVSVGPKETTLPEDLPRYLIHIQNLEVVPNPQFPNRPFHKATWDIIVDEGHQALMDEHDAMNANFIAQEQEEMEIADGFLIDDYNVSLHEIELAKLLFSDDNLKDEIHNEDSVITSHDPHED